MVNEKIIKSLSAVNFNDLLFLKNYLNFNFDNLKKVHDNSKLEAQGIEQVFVVDFQEIYTYLYPYPDFYNISPSAKPPIDSALIANIFNNLSFKFIFLDGTWYELIKHLAWLNKKRLKHCIDYSEFHDIEKSLINVRNNHHKINTIEPGRPINTLNKARKFTEDLLSIEASLNRLKYLLTSDRFFDLTRFFEKKKFSIPEELYNSIFSDLENRRKTRKIAKKKEERRKFFYTRSRTKNANRADAINMASIIALNEYFKEGYEEKIFDKQYRFNYLTHTKTLFGLPEYSVEFYDHTISGEQIHILRTPINLIYDREFKKEYPNPYLRKQAIRALRSKCFDSQLKLEALEDKDDNDLFNSQYIEYLDEKKNLHSLQKADEIYGPIRSFLHDQTINKLMQYLFRSGQDNRALLDSETYESDFSISRAHRLGNVFCSIFNIVGTKMSTVYYLQRIDKLDNLFKLFGFYFEININEKLSRKELRICDNANNFVFGLDYYFDLGIYSIYWDNIILKKEFVRTLNRIIKNSNFNAHELTDAAFDILMIDVSKKSHRISCNYPIENVSIKIRNKEVPIVFLRVNTSVCDFCCEFIGSSTKRSGKIGIISRNVRFDIINELYIESSTYPQLMIPLSNETLVKIIEDYF